MRQDQVNMGELGVKQFVVAKDPAGIDNSYYRMLLETHFIAETQTTVYEATKDEVAYFAPPGVLKSPRGFGSTCLGIFEFDGLVQEVGFVG